ncbi:unnamed protein product [Lymnaea stagnalis]|uniref:Uncharacterized protein n=1 Tax=Lymnaea stagnalis TaxID=6523 RepID=A0AAV2HNA5_LYMST
MPQSFPEEANMGVCSPIKSGNTPDNSKHVKSVDSSTSIFMPDRIPFKSVHSAGMSDDKCKSDSTISKLSNSPIGPSLNASLEKTPKFKFRKSTNTPKPKKHRNPSDKKFTESPRGCDNRQHQRNLQSTDR